MSTTSEVPTPPEPPALVKLLQAGGGGDVPSKLAELLGSGGAKVNETDHKKRAAVHYACISGDTASLRQLAGAGADLNLTDQHGVTALMLAAACDKIDCVSYLCKKGAKLDQQDKNGATAAIHASTRDNYGICITLGENGANLNLSDANGGTALMHSVVRHFPKTFEGLAMSGADVNQQDKNGLTALMYGVLHTRSDDDLLFVQKVLAMNPNPYIQASNGDTVMDMVKEAHPNLKGLVMHYFEQSQKVVQSQMQKQEIQEMRALYRAEQEKLPDDKRNVLVSDKEILEAGEEIKKAGKDKGKVQEIDQAMKRKMLLDQNAFRKWIRDRQMVAELCELEAKLALTEYFSEKQKGVEELSEEAQKEHFASIKPPFSEEELRAEKDLKKQAEMGAKVEAHLKKIADDDQVVFKKWFDEKKKEDPMRFYPRRLPKKLLDAEEEWAVEMEKRPEEERPFVMRPGSLEPSPEDMAKLTPEQFKDAEKELLTYRLVAEKKDREMFVKWLDEKKKENPDKYGDIDPYHKGDVYDPFEGMDEANLVAPTSVIKTERQEDAAKLFASATGGEAASAAADDEGDDALPEADDEY